MSSAIAWLNGKKAYLTAAAAALTAAVGFLDGRLTGQGFALTVLAAAGLVFVRLPVARIEAAVNGLVNPPPKPPSA